jgi:hypothetical protein
MTDSFETETFDLAILYHATEVLQLQNVKLEQGRGNSIREASSRFAVLAAACGRLQWTLGWSNLSHVRLSVRGQRRKTLSTTEEPDV